MATLSRGQTFGATETVTNTKLHNLVDLATISGIVDEDISPGAAIQFSKLLASSISGALLTNLNLIPTAAGVIPFANLPLPLGATYVTLVSIPNSSLQPITLASWVDGASLRNVQSIPTLAGTFATSQLVTSLASGGHAIANGAGGWSGDIRYKLAAGTGLVSAYDEEESTVSTSSANPSSKRLYVPKSGTLRISVDLKALAADIASVQIYRHTANASVAVGTIMTNATTAYVTRTQDLASWIEGDFVGMNLWSGAGATVSEQRFRIFASRG